MPKPTFNKKRLEKLMGKVFPNSQILSYKKFETGLVSPTYKVKIKNPDETLVIKLSKLKNRKKIETNNKILEYLNKHNIPSPEIYLYKIFDKKYITIMEFVGGDVASKIYKNSSKKTRKTLLKNAGQNLRKIHNLKVPYFWVHHHHEIKNINQWKKWTRNRIEKYLKFFEKKFPKYKNYLEKELNEFYEILKKEKRIKFVPLHWDYHLSNLNSNKKGEITGTFDFDNAMKGHNLADLGQSAYWIRSEQKNHKNFKYFLEGYNKKFSQKELKLIKGYFLLHLLAVSRTIWFRKKRLGWLIKNHKKILEGFIRGKI